MHRDYASPKRSNTNVQSRRVSFKHKEDSKFTGEIFQEETKNNNNNKKFIKSFPRATISRNYHKILSDFS